MNPNIGYVRSADGTRIAFWTLGAGPPLLLLPNLPASSIEMEWATPACREWYESMAADHLLIGYDGRGNGLSQRDLDDYSFEAQVADARAVVERVGGAPMAIFAIVYSCPVGIALAAREPGTFERLILWGPYARGEDHARSPSIHAARVLLKDDWKRFTETLGFYAFGWNMPEQARAMSAWFNEATNQQTVIKQMDARDFFDVTADLEHVRVPTLVLHRRHAAWPRMETAATVAASIPNARMVMIDGDTTNPWAENRDQLQRAVAEFMAEPLPEVPPPPPPVAVPTAESRAPSLPVDSKRLCGLTFRELEVLQHIAAGAGNREIAQALYVSVRTVEKHTANIYGKLGARGRADAAAWAVRNVLTPATLLQGEG